VGGRKGGAGGNRMHFQSIQKKGRRRKAKEAVKRGGKVRKRGNRTEKGMVIHRAEEGTSHCPAQRVLRLETKDKYQAGKVRSIVRRTPHKAHLSN